MGPRLRCVICGDPTVEAKNRCGTCRRYLNRTGTDRTHNHIAKLTARDIERQHRQAR